MILEPLSKQELEQIFDDVAVDVIKYFLEKTILLQPELNVGQEPLPIQIPKEHIEQWMVQSLNNVKSVGAGSYPVDISRENDFVADVKMMSCKVDANGNLKDALSGETSLAQKFQGTGTNLDSLFRDGKYDEILDGWKEIVKNKYETILLNKNLKLYYFFFLRAGIKFYLCGIKVNVEQVNYAIVSERSNKNNVYVDNYIDGEFGEIKIYKAKKRMELRLYPKKWVDANNVLVFEPESNINRVNLREKSLKGQLSDYKNQNFKSMIKH